MQIEVNANTLYAINSIIQYRDMRRLMSYYYTQRAKRR